VRRIVVGGADISLEEYVANPLWSILVETVHAMIMFPHHKAYTRNVILNEQPDTTPSNLATKLGIPLGEAIVILHELKKEKTESSKSISSQTK